MIGKCKRVVIGLGARHRGETSNFAAEQVERYQDQHESHAKQHDMHWRSPSISQTDWHLRIRKECKESAGICVIIRLFDKIACLTWTKIIDK